MQELKKCLLIFLLFLFANFLHAQNQNLLKNFLTVEDGLSHNEVISIVQDHDGFIWIGTRGGLNRYDGYEFKIFNQVPGDSNSLVNPSIESLFVDSKGNVWIGTKSGGVSKYNPVTGIFKNIVTNYKQSSAILNDNRVLAFYEDKEGQIWIGTWGSGLIIYNEQTNSSKHYLGQAQVSAIVGTKDNRIWVGGRYENGLYEYDQKNDTLLIRRPDLNNFPCLGMRYDSIQNVLWVVPGNNSGLIKFDLRNYKNKIYKIGESDKNDDSEIHEYESLSIDNDGKIWVGTWGTGLYVFDPKLEKFKRNLIYPKGRPAFNKDYDAIPGIFQDKDNTIWLGTNGGGVCVLSPQMGFHSIGYHPMQNKGLVNTRIMTVLEDHANNLWLGTIGSGLVWSPDRENFYQVPCPLIDKSGYLVIKYLYEDKLGNVWLGTNDGTYVLEFRNGQPQMIKASVKFGNITLNTAVSLLDAQGMFWIGTLEHGLFLYDKKDHFALKKHLTKNDKLSGNQKSDRISYLLQDSKERIWLGTYNGLHIYNPADTTIQVAEIFFEMTGEFTGNIITSIDEDLHGNIWIGTPNGLNKLTETGPNKFDLSFYTQENGLASNFIKGIAHDSDDNIWLSTGLGISKYKTRENEFVNFDEADGVLGKNFTEASVFRNKSGELFFGGTLGLTYFSPDQITEHSLALKPRFTSLKILNEQVKIGENYLSKVILKKAINSTDTIELSYRQNKIELQFSALDYQSEGRNQYQYKLENYDKDWVSIGSRRFVIFNNLHPGEYIFKVKSANRHNHWNEEPATLTIRISPPFWQTWYALVFYILVVVGIVTIIRRNAIKQVRLNNSLEMEKLQHEQDLKMNEMKLRFFTNLSHEFRTPLTLILAPLKELLGKREDYQLSNEAQNKIGIVQNNSLRLMNLVNQLLDFRKVESGNMKLAASNTNLGEFVAEICHPFIELARINNISFKLNTSLKTKNIWVDRDKLEIILNNLISNSFKNIGVDGKIEIALYEEEDVVLLCVSDNGKGIPKVDIDNIFERFYRVGQSTGHGSSGIGLALVKRYAELHKASISVVSEVDKRTEFTVSLLKGSNHLAPEEMVEFEHSEKNFVHKEQFFSSVLPIKEKVVAKSDDCILIVEDNPEVNAYLVSVLESLYCVYSAHDGSEGYDLALDKVPNLIISDVMMPKMDGFEFCKKIRENSATATIPFVFLTAKSDEQFKLLGTQLGADDFISKPFDPNLLLEKIKNIFKSREKLQKQYGKSIRLEPSDIEITSAEEVFIEKVILFIEENLQNHKFKSDVLASEMNMSNSTLYRKLKNLTGNSTAEFIRSIRIKRAAQLLADKSLTITEIAYNVGFNDVKHFRTVFQRQFKCSPSEYKEKLL